MSGVIFLADIDKAYIDIANGIDKGIDMNDARRREGRMSGSNLGEYNDGKLDGFEYSLFCKQLKERVAFDFTHEYTNDAYHCWGDSEKFAKGKISAYEQAADIRQNKAGGPFQWAYNLLHKAGLI